MTRVSDLQRRVARLEARAAIQELLVRYTLLIDDHEFDALGELFTVDAVFGSPGGAHRGRAALVEHYRRRGAQYPVSLHVVRGVVLEFPAGTDDDTDDDRARGQVVGFSEQAGEHSVVTAFRYDDEYTRVDGRWCFASRLVRTLYAMTHAELAAGGLGRPLRNRWPHRAPAGADLPPGGVS